MGKKVWPFSCPWFCYWSLSVACPLAWCRGARASSAARGRCRGGSRWWRAPAWAGRRSPGIIIIMIMINMIIIPGRRPAGSRDPAERWSGPRQARGSDTQSWEEINTNNLGSRDESLKTRNLSWLHQKYFLCKAKRRKLYIISSAVLSWVTRGLKEDSLWRI